MNNHELANIIRDKALMCDEDDLNTLLDAAAIIEDLGDDE